MWPRFGEQFQKHISHSNIYLIALCHFWDLHLSLPKKSHHCLAAVVTSDTWIGFARIWRDLQGESLINAWANFPIHPFEVLSVTHPGLNADLSVLTFLPLLRDKRKPTNSINFMTSGDCPLPWFLVPFPPQMLMEPFLEHTKSYESMIRAQSNSGIPVDQVVLPICAHSGLSRDHCSNSSAGQVFEAMLQRSGPHIFSACWWANYKMFTNLERSSYNSVFLLDLLEPQYYVEVLQVLLLDFFFFWMLPSSNFDEISLELCGKND